MIVRRVVTGHSGGKAVVVSDGRTPRSHDFVHLQGMSTALVWSTPPVAKLPHDGKDPIGNDTTFIPPRGETRLMVVAFPPDSLAMAPGFDGAAVGKESTETFPDIAAKIEPDHPGMHTTDSVDYAIVLEGEAWLELDDGKEVHLKPHDIVIQNGTRHAWRNKGTKPVKVAFVLIGAARKSLRG
jgi:mannose-6-phosphate isomerase-like protein (cupin superfamily)